MPTVIAALLLATDKERRTKERILHFHKIQQSFLNRHVSFPHTKNKALFEANKGRILLMLTVQTEKTKTYFQIFIFPFVNQHFFFVFTAILKRIVTADIKVKKHCFKF